jgi:hypothetical protein
VRARRALSRVLSLSLSKAIYSSHDRVYPCIQKLLLRLLDLIQAQQRLSLKPWELLLTQNFVKRDNTSQQDPLIDHEGNRVMLGAHTDPGFEGEFYCPQNALNLYAIFRAFLHHCGLPSPELEAEEANLQVLECFKASVSILFKGGRIVPAATLDGLGARARFLLRTASASTASPSKKKVTQEEPLFLERAPLAREGSQRHTPNLGHLRPDFAGTSSSVRTPTLLWRRVRVLLLVQNLVKKTLPALAAGAEAKRAAEERKMLASTVHKFLSEELCLEHVLELATSLGAIKTDAKLGLELCSMLRNRYTGSMLSQFSNLCLGNLHLSWQAMQETGVYDSLGSEIRAFILDLSIPVLREAASTQVSIPVATIPKTLEVQEASYSAAMASCALLSSDSAGLRLLLQTEMLECLMPLCKSDEANWRTSKSPSAQQRQQVCMQSRASLLVVVLSVVDKILADDADIAIAELHSIWDAFSRRVSAWAQAAVEDKQAIGLTLASKSYSPSNGVSGASREALAFGFGVIDIIFSAFRECPENFQAQIFAGCELMLRLFVAIVKSDEQGDGVSHLSIQAGALLGAFSALLPPSSCDKVAVSLTASPLFQATGADVGATKAALQHDSEPGLPFLCCFTVAVLKRHTQDSAEPQPQPSSDLTSCVANIISILAAGLDDEGRDWWTPALIKFVQLNSAAPLVDGGDVLALKILGGNIASSSLGEEVELTDGLSGVIVHDALPAASAVSVAGFGAAADKQSAPVFGAPAFGVPSATAAKPPITASPASTQSPAQVWVTLADGSVQQQTLASYLFKSPYIGRLNPKTMELLIKYVQASKPTLLRVAGIAAPSAPTSAPCARNPGGGGFGAPAPGVVGAFGAAGMGGGFAAKSASGFGAATGAVFGLSTGAAFGAPQTGGLGDLGFGGGGVFGQPKAAGAPFGARPEGGFGQPAASVVLGPATGGGFGASAAGGFGVPQTGGFGGGFGGGASFGSPAAPSALFGKSPASAGAGNGTTSSTSSGDAAKAMTGAGFGFGGGPAASPALATGAAFGFGGCASFGSPAAPSALFGTSPTFAGAGNVATDSTASGDAENGMTCAVVAGSPQGVAIKADLMKRELRIIKAVVEHSACYEGFGDHVVGEFATMGEKEIAAMLDETTFDDHKILASLMELALSAGQFGDFHWAVRALEYSVIALENKKESANLPTCISSSELRTLATPSKQEEVANAAFALVVKVQVPQRVCVSLCACVPPQMLPNVSFCARLHSSTLNRMFSICAGDDTS